MEISIFAITFLATFCLSQEQYEVPLAPYNVKLMCRQGRRFSRQAQTPNQCPSSSTTCGFFELPMTDQKHGTPKTGFYDCVDGGILSEDSGEVDDDADDRVFQRTPSFEKMCGAVAKCTFISIETLNPSFVKYLVQEYDIKLEGLEKSEIRFCCALFHSTLQKLVTSPSYQLPQISTAPITCQGQVCDAGAVGCLLHATHDEEDYENYDDKKRRVKRLQLNDYIADSDEEYVNAVELSFDDLDIELITRQPSLESESETKSTTTSTTVMPTTTTPTITTTTPIPKLPSLRLPLFLEDITSTTPMTTTTSTTPPPTTTARLTTTSNKFWKKAKVDSEEEEWNDNGEEEPNQSTHCVYRHLNNEFYRYCLLVHQSRDGDRCYHHQGHTICCCFVAPDKETCDPTEMDLIVPPPPSQSAVPTRVVITVPASTTTTSTSTTTTTTTTPTPTPTTTKYPTLPPQIYRYRSIDQTKSRKQKRKRCRVTYVRTKSGSRTRPVLVCDVASAAVSYLLPIICSLFLVFYRFME